MPNRGAYRDSGEATADCASASRRPKSADGPLPVELIDRQIEGFLSPEERVELDFLQQQFRGFRQQDAPLPIEKARQLHRELLEKKRRQ